jgi:acetyl esterase
MTLDKSTQAIVAASRGGPPIHELGVTGARQMARSLVRRYGPLADVARVREVRIPLQDGAAVPARVLEPVNDPRATIVYFHGGGWVLGGPDEYEHVARQLALATRCTTVLVDYRRAPEHRYPAAANDAWDTLQWTAANVAATGAPVIVAGDSAGGNLAAVVAQRARAEGGPDVALQVLVYPIADCDLDTASYLDPQNQLVLTRATMAWFWDLYVPDVRVRANADASPLRATDLRGLPPAVVITAEHDVLRDEGEAYAERLRRAGVPVTARRFAGQMHGFFAMAGLLPGQAEALAYVARAIEERLARVSA